jgi:hypothetical protein
LGQPNVVSREYKVMLLAHRFKGDEKALLKTAGTLWRDFSRNVDSIVLECNGGLKEIKKRRLITFRDTARHDLNRASYIFRERLDVESGEREVTLKFRHADPYVARNRTMESRERKSDRTKFEEDIKAPFVPLYSFSTTVAIGGGRAFGALGDVARLFPDVPKQLDTFPHRKALSAVNGFTAREVVIGGAAMRMGKTPRVDAECALIVWYDQEGRKDKPVAVEFSFRYGDRAGNYGGTMARRAFDVFHALQRRLGRWVDPKPRTKTAFVYG